MWGWLELLWHGFVNIPIAKTVTLLCQKMRNKENWKDPPDNFSKTGAKGPVLWSEELSHHCVRHRPNSHSISNCCHHQRDHKANLLSFIITKAEGRKIEDIKLPGQQQDTLSPGPEEAAWQQGRSLKLTWWRWNWQIVSLDSSWKHFGSMLGHIYHWI